MTTRTVRIDHRPDATPREAAARAGTGRSAFVREAVRRRSAVAGLQPLRRSAAPFAEAHGGLTDEGVFGEVS